MSAQKKMRTAGRKQVLLALLAVVLLPALWRGLQPAPPALPEAAAARALPAPRVQGRVAETVEELRGLRLTPAGGAPPGRDPWRFVEPAPVAAVSHVRSAVATPVSAAAAIVAPAPVAVRPAPAPFPWQYLGTFGPAGRRIAVFADPARQGEVHNAREGEALTQGFVLERIGLESVDVRRAGAAQPAQRLSPGGRVPS